MACRSAGVLRSRSVIFERRPGEEAALIATAAVILALTAYGALLVRALHDSRSKAQLAGESLLLGFGCAAVSLFLLSLCRIRWSAASLAASLAAIAAVALIGRRYRSIASDHVRGAPIPHAWMRIVVTGAGALTLLALIGYAIFATVVPMWEWDFRAIWGLKGRAFLEHGGIDWAFLSRPDNTFVHPDYPLLVPLLFDAVSLFTGSWDDRALALLFPAIAGAVLLAAHGLLREETGSPVAELALVGAVGFACSPFVGLAETPLIAFSTIALLLIRRGIAGADRELLAGSVFLGLAAFTKLEGETLLVAALLSAAIALRRSPRRMINLWPAIAIAAPWILAVRVLRLPNDIAQGSAMSRLISRVSDPAQLLHALASNPPARPGFWIAVLVALAVWNRLYRKREGFLLVAILLQVGFFLAAYAVTANDLAWQVATSWPRLLNQVGMLLLFLLAFGARQRADTKAGSGESEAPLPARAGSGTEI